MNISLYEQSGKKKGEIEANPAIFSVEWLPGLVHEALIRQNANSRRGTAKTLTRAYVRGGGRKPYRQKGTGRARQGSISAPHYRGGGVVFGPTGKENYKLQMPKKMRRKALFSSLSLRASEQKVVVLDSFVLDKPKTKEMLSFMKTFSDAKNILLIFAKKDFILEKSSANLPNVEILSVQYLNVVDILKSDMVIFMEDALQKVEEIFFSE
jgi:large subunit ribosomal protein L4